MKSVSLFLGSFLLIIMLPLSLGALHDFRVENYEQSISTVTTGAGENTTTVILSQELWQDDINAVLSVSSNITADSPSADSFNNVTNGLTVGGLVASQTRTLTIEYEIPDAEVVSNMSQVDVLVIVILVLVIFSILAVIVAGIAEAVRSFVER